MIKIKEHYLLKIVIIICKKYKKYKKYKNKNNNNIYHLLHIQKRKKIDQNQKEVYKVLYHNHQIELKRKKIKILVYKVVMQNLLLDLQVLLEQKNILEEILLLVELPDLELIHLLKNQGLENIKCHRHFKDI